METFYTHVALMGDMVLYRGYEKGKRVLTKSKYTPSFFLPDDNGEFRTIQGKKLKRKSFPSISKAREFVQRYSDMDGFEYYGYEKYAYCYLWDKFRNPVDYNVDKIIVANLDLECESEHGFPEPSLAQEKITSITCKIKDRYYVFGHDFPFDAKGDKNIFYIKCATEKILLEKFLKMWDTVKPDIITGWFLASFDIPYLTKRMENVLGTHGAKLMSPWGMTVKRNLRRKERVLEVVEPLGVSVLDYFDLYKKFAPNPNQAADSLNHIAEVELDEKKLDYSEYSTLHELYKYDYQKYVDYNIRDVYLVDKLEKKLGLINMSFGLAYDSRVNYIDVLSQVRMWENIIYGYFLNDKIVVPKQKHATSSGYAGAHVKEPVPGLYEWVCSFDLNSLYPHIIRQWNISPETITNQKLEFTVEDLIEERVIIQTEGNYSVAANGHTFNNDHEGFLPKILMEMYEERKKFKNLQIEKEKELELIEAEIHRRGLS